MISDTLIRITYSANNQENTSAIRNKCCTNKLFKFIHDNNQTHTLLHINILITDIKQQTPYK